jgi:hypothetical protein
MCALVIVLCDQKTVSGKLTVYVPSQQVKGDGVVPDFNMYVACEIMLRVRVVVTLGKLPPLTHWIESLTVCRACQDAIKI